MCGSPDDKRSITAECCLGAAAAANACLFTNPLEVVKTRMQLQGELQSRGDYARHYKNVFQAFYTIARHEGLRSLQKGLVPGVWYQVFMNGPRLGIYQTLDNYGFLRECYERENEKNSRSEKTENQNVNEEMSNIPKSAKPLGGVIFYRSVAAAAFSGVIGAFIASPFYLVKTQLQSQSAHAISVGYQHEHSSMSRAFLDVIRKRGFFALWTGVTAAIPRVMVGSSVQLTTFAYSKQLIDRGSIREHVHPLARMFFASAISGVVVVVFMTPFDVVSTRIYNQPVGAISSKAYSGFFNCVFKIASTEGLWGFYKGIGPCFFRIAPHTTLSLIFWEQIRRFATRTNML